MTQNFAEFVAEQRRELGLRRIDLTQQREVLDKAIADIDRELGAVAAYEAAKNGTVLGVAGGKVTTRHTSERQARKGSKRQVLIDTLASASNPMSRGELIEALGSKGDRSHEMSISNALTALIKTGQVAREGGKYVLPAVH